MISSSKFLELVYDAATSYIPKDELNGFQKRLIPKFYFFLFVFECLQKSVFLPSCFRLPFPCEPVRRRRLKGIPSFLERFFAFVHLTAFTNHIEFIFKNP